MIAIFSLVLCTILLVLSSFFLYQLMVLKQIIVKTKMKLSQNTIALRVIYKNIQALESNIQSQSTMLTKFDQQTLNQTNPNDKIEHQYTRAKRILQQGSEEDIHSLHSCDMTEEEMELLTDLMQAN